MEFKKNLKNTENWFWIGKEMTLLESPMSTRHVKHPRDLHFKLFVRQIRWCHDGLFIDTNCGQLFLTGGIGTGRMRCYYGKNHNDRYFLSLIRWDSFQEWKFKEYSDYYCENSDCYELDSGCSKCKKKFLKDYNKYLKRINEGEYVILLREFDGNRPHVEKKEKKHVK